MKEIMFMIYLILTCLGGYYILGESYIMTGLRKFLSDNCQFLYKLITCEYCLCFWLTIKFMFLFYFIGYDSMIFKPLIVVGFLFLINKIVGNNKIKFL